MKIYSYQITAGPEQLTVPLGHPGLPAWLSADYCAKAAQLLAARELLSMKVDISIWEGSDENGHIKWRQISTTPTESSGD